MRRWATALLLLIALPVRAEDPREWLGIPNGGLLIPSTDGLALQSFDLRLAPSKVEATYELLNGAETPLILRLAFVLPSERLKAGSLLSLPPFEDAQVLRGAEVVEITETSVRIFMRDQDVTDMLTAAGIDPTPLLGVEIAKLPRLQRRALEQALRDRGVEADGRHWHTGVARVWMVELEPRDTVVVKLRYTPFPGGGFDRYPGDAAVEDLAHLDAYCADDQEGLLDWVRTAASDRAAQMQAELQGAGQTAAEAKAESYADILLSDLAFKLTGNAWLDSYPNTTLSIDPEGGRAAFCFDGKAVAPDSDGLYRLQSDALPAEGRFDVMFFH